MLGNFVRRILRRGKIRQQDTRIFFRNRVVGSLFNLYFIVSLPFSSVLLYLEIRRCDYNNYYYFRWRTPNPPANDRPSAERVLTLWPPRTVTTTDRSAAAVTVVTLRWPPPPATTRPATDGLTYRMQNNPHHRAREWVGTGRDSASPYPLQGNRTERTGTSRASLPAQSAPARIASVEWLFFFRFQKNSTHLPNYYYHFYFAWLLYNIIILILVYVLL